MPKDSFPPERVESSSEKDVTTHPEPVTQSRTRTILTLALPIIGGMVSQNILNLVDTAMVGTLGDEALAAVGVGGMVNFVLSAFILGMASGVQTIAARRIGEGRTEQAAWPLNGGLFLACCTAIPWSVFAIFFTPNILGLVIEDNSVIPLCTPYLQTRLIAMVALGMNFSFRAFWNATNRPMLYMRTILTMHVVNISLNWLLIFGNLGFPEMGVHGAGIASAISTYVGTLTYFILAAKHARKNGFLKSLPNRATLKTIIKLSVPTGLQQFFFAGGLTTFFWIVGKVGTSELAATQVVVNLLLVGVLPGMGFGLASTSLVSQALGRKNTKDAAQWGWDVAKLSSFVMGAIALVPLLFPRLVLSVFIHEPATLELAILPLRITMVGLFFDSFGIVLMHSLNGAGATGKTMVVSFSQQWLLFLPAAYIVGPVLGLGVAAIWLAQVLSRTIQTFVFIGLWSSGSWKKIKV